MKYTAVLELVERSRAEVQIHALSLAEAKEKAAMMTFDRVQRWTPLDGTVTTVSVRETPPAPPRNRRPSE
jgi:hypothetical protein